MTWNKKKFSFYFTPESRLKIYRWLLENGIKPIDPANSHYDKIEHPHPVFEPYYVIKIPVVKISKCDISEETDDYWIPAREVNEIVEGWDKTTAIPIIKDNTA